MQKIQRNMLNKAFYVVFLLFFSFNASQSQILSPVKWSYAAKKIGDQEAVLFLKATIEPGWHIYSAYQKSGGPSKTTFKFINTKAINLKGPISEPKPIEHFENAFDMNVQFFEKEVVFQQKIALKLKEATVQGSVEFMVCNDEKCLPPERISFAIPVK